MNHKVQWILLGLALLTLSLAFSAVTARTQSLTPVNVEPPWLPAEQGGTISIYATGTLTFTEGYTARLLGYGILETTYVNETTLQAVVPTNVPPNGYELWILDQAGKEVGTGQLLLTPPATPTATPESTGTPKPTRTPKPEKTPAPGSPNLAIRNYNVTPMQVKPGSTFVVSIEVYNNGSRAAENTMAVFPGGTFIPLGETGHMFWQIPINGTFVVSQQMQVPQSAQNGIHEIKVNISANDWAGNHFEFPQTVSVEVIGATDGTKTATGKPKIIIEGVETHPAVVAPGTPFTLTLTLANRGSRTAINIIASADDTLVVPASGGSAIATDVLPIDGTTTVQLQLLLKPNKEGGRQGLPIALEYSDYDGGSYSDKQSVGFDVDTSLANRPQLLINQYASIPEKISPGDTFTLTLQLVNVGGSDAQRLTLALGGEEGENLGVFAPLDGSNVIFVPSVRAGETKDLTLRMMIAGSAETKAHSLPIELAYDTGGGTREKDTQRISLLVQRRPDFKIDFYRPIEGSAMAGQPFQLPIEVVNASSARFNVSEIAVTGEGLEFLEGDSVFVGNLEPGGSWTVDTLAMAAQAGPTEVIVNVHYIDDLNQTQIVSETLMVEVMEMFPDMMGPNGSPMEPGEAQPESFWGKVGRFFKGILGLGS
ncbi:MAG: hypothetical protein RBT47_10470 [Anaerolineae bacterium]|jgi:hypothetical protein|nr:hypothetical protein [Anaerolineae bacterium]